MSWYWVGPVVKQTGIIQGDPINHHAHIVYERFSCINVKIVYHEFIYFFFFGFFSIHKTFKKMILRLKGFNLTGLKLINMFRSILLGL